MKRRVKSEEKLMILFRSGGYYGFRKQSTSAKFNEHEMFKYCNTIVEVKSGSNPFIGEPVFQGQYHYFIEEWLEPLKEKFIEVEE